MLARTLVVAVLGAVLLPGCGDEEIKSTCVPGEACEQDMLNRCTCCGDQAKACRQDRTDACATGRLGLTLSAEECAKNNDTWKQIQDADQDPCSKIDAEELQQYCDERILDEEEGGEGESD